MYIDVKQGSFLFNEYPHAFQRQYCWQDQRMDEVIFQIHLRTIATHGGIIL